MNKLKIRYLPLAIVFLGIVLATVVIPFAFGKEETSNRTVIKTTTDFTPKPPAAAGKHALLIAIQDYDSGKTGFHSLKGPANDIQLIKGMLRERFGFQDGNFTILQDDQATHTNIESAFMILVQMVQPGDFVYIHYSGHGSQTADLNGDETSGKDQTWVSYGARASKEAHKDNYDVLDDEINAWLAALYAKTDQVVFVSDSCHSATVSKGFNLTRAIDDDDRPHILGQLPYTQLANHRGIRVGAARDDESAIDKRRDDGKYYGVFSWHWARNLQQTQTGDTWDHVFKRTYAQITDERGLGQQPQMEGDRQTQVLGGGFIAQPPTIAVMRITDDHQVELKAGSLAGVTEGSVYRLYNPQHPDPETLPSLTITNATTFISYGEPEPKGSFKVGDLVVEESHAYHFTPIKVTLEADFPNGEDQLLLQAIQTAFQTRSDETQPFPAYTLTDDPSNTDLRLHLLRPKHGQFIRAKANDPLPKSFPNQPPELWVLTPEQRLLAENLRIHFDNPARGVQLLQDNLNKLARIREIKGLQSRRGRKIPVTLQAHILSPVAFCQEGPNCLFLDGKFYRKANNYSLPEIQQLTLTSKQILTFTLRNEDKWVNYYCYILNIGPDGAIYSIFPLAEDRMEDPLVPARKTRELFEEQIGLVTELVGEETIKFITSRYPIDVKLLEQEAFQQRGGQLNQLERLLFGYAVHGERGSPMKRNDDWATGQVGFQVEE
ncbi:MAG: hypothetical protein DRR19_13410 [Candidatus Parabeggiatoa sp. nov. 1]|nr:MAG: hypothetical protein DRR19_13410 [Gammaproteobacteria bacterium]